MILILHPKIKIKSQVLKVDFYTLFSYETFTLGKNHFYVLSFLLGIFRDFTKITNIILSILLVVG